MWQGRLTYQHGTRSAQFIKSAQENEKDSNRLSGGVGVDETYSAQFTVGVIKEGEEEMNWRC